MNGSAFVKDLETTLKGYKMSYDHALRNIKKDWLVDWPSWNIEQQIRQRNPILKKRIKLFKQERTHKKMYSVL